MAGFWLWVLRPLALLAAGAALAAGGLAVASWDLALAAASAAGIVTLAANRAGASAARRRVRARVPAEVVPHPAGAEAERRRAA